MWWVVRHDSLLILFLLALAPIARSEILREGCIRKLRQAIRKGGGQEIFKANTKKNLQKGMGGGSEKRDEGDQKSVGKRPDVINECSQTRE